jgi:hypothetical protein
MLFPGSEIREKFPCKEIFAECGNRREEAHMDFGEMSREELIHRIKELTEYMDNVIVFWGGRREFRQTLEGVACNEDGEYTAEEAANASAILESEESFNDFVELLRESFDRGGINYVISEKISAVMAEAAARCRRGPDSRGH